jgi:hypothetical protein
VDRWSLADPMVNGEVILRLGLQSERDTQLAEQPWPPRTAFLLRCIFPEPASELGQLKVMSG